jgi:HEAT repeat protein
MQRQNLLFCAAGVLLLAAVAFYGWRWMSAPSKPSAEKLAGVALSGDPDERQEAALMLIALGDPAVPLMRRVLRQSEAPEVRAAMIQGLIGQYDYASMPAILDALDDESPLVRMRAAPAVLKLLCFDVSYSSDDPPEKRREAVKACRQRWETMLKMPRMKAKLAGVQSPD